MIIVTAVAAGAAAAGAVAAAWLLNMIYRLHPKK